MAARRPAKIASNKKGKATAKVHPETGKPMMIAKLVRASGPTGIFWVPEDFDGSEAALRQVIPVR